MLEADDKPRRGRRKKEEPQDTTVEQVEQQDTTPETVEQPKQMNKPSKAVLLKNIKYKGKHYKIGQSIEIDTKDREAFVKNGIIGGD